MERQLITLSNHPQIPTVTRKAKVLSSINSYNGNAVYMDVKIFHYINNVELKYFPSSVQLVGDNNSFVDATGEAVPSDTVGAIGEYDFLWNLINVAKAFTQEQLEDSYVVKRTLIIDKKLYE